MSDPTIDIPTDGTLLHAVVDAGRLVAVEDAMAGLLDTLTRTVWAEVKDRLGALVHGLGGRELAEGVSLYDIDLRLGDDWTRTVQRRGTGSLAVTIVSGRNTVIATSTTPTPLGSWADPRFSLDFGAMATVVLSVPPALGAVHVTAVEDVRVLVQRVDSQNLAGDVAVGLLRLAEALTDLSVEGLLQQALDSVDLTGRADAVLAPLNERIVALAADGYSYQELLAGDAASLARQLADAYGIPDAAQLLRSAGAPTDTQALLLVGRRPDRSGVVEGEIAWPAAQGAPVDRRLAAALDRITSTFLSDTSLTLVRERVSSPVGRSAWLLQTRDALPARRVTSDVVVADAAALAPMASAATAAVQRPTTSSSVWDSAGPAPELPPQVGPVLFDAADLSEALGGRGAYELLMDAFRRGPVQFDVTCTNPSGTPSGRTTVMWWDDDEAGWSRRRYRVEGVETDTPLTVGCALGPDWVWRGGSVGAVDAVNWDGRVTVRPARDLADELSSADVQASVRLADGSRRTVSLEVLERAGVVGAYGRAEQSGIIVGGRPGEQVSLNPQPLPPREGRTVREWVRTGLRRGAGQLRGEGSLTERFGSIVDTVRGTVRGGVADRTSTRDQVSDAVRERHGGIADGARDVVGTVDAFGSLTLPALDVGDLSVPDVHDPVGYGTVRGIDFRVRVD
ncbi:hypothetical protein [Ornithinimicrobium sp. LYQ103]|uniref:hypothetical protein n=1 Tax=Ornithinimicrobium sp. LYQ103 TaxID=3378796 RepID=UPI003854FFAE